MQEQWCSPKQRFLIRSHPFNQHPVSAPAPDLTGPTKTPNRFTPWVSSFFNKTWSCFGNSGITALSLSDTWNQALSGQRNALKSSRETAGAAFPSHQGTHSFSCHTAPASFKSFSETFPAYFGKKLGIFLTPHPHLFLAKSTLVCCNQ